MMPSLPPSKMSLRTPLAIPPIDPPTKKQTNKRFRMDLGENNLKSADGQEASALRVEVWLPIDEISAALLLVYFGVSTLLDASSSGGPNAKEEQKEAEITVYEVLRNGETGFWPQNVKYLAGTSQFWLQPRRLGDVFHPKSPIQNFTHPALIYKP
ncbi:hypothetical protein L1987_57867 [Smallanthus sonchifolius]|uniref:Uncharacterized protein n=1 Tax=Smallanthus sonchifolius TaxID=185202 RepID=A0ACB9DET5_9ASTR|nr:hypothetical protein L1987_57867 [Smallanthus sonchifolius]